MENQHFADTVMNRL